jgi:exopolysaccharide biosynthesis polyprenyl glycosylphosphotransferase
VISEQARRAAPAPSPAEPAEPARARRLSFRLRHGLWKDALRRRMLAVADLCATATAIVALALAVPAHHRIVVWAVATLPIAVVLAKVQGLYDADHRRLRHLTTDEIPSLFMWVTLWVAAMALLVSLVGAPGLDGVAAATMWACAFGTAVVLRASARVLWRRLVPRELTLVLGDGELARMLARKLALEPGHHVALLDGSAAGTSAAGAPFDLEDDLEPTIRALDVERVVIAREDLDESSFREIARVCRDTRAKLSVMPPLPAMLGTAVALTHLAELPLIEFKTWDPSRSTMLLKRILDIGGGTLALILLAPLMASIAFAVRLDSPGPALFRQRRAGKDGRPFTMLKFRTMVDDAEHRLADLVDLAELPEPMFKLREDPRVTRIGRVLRRASLDELPQLLNVVAGHMSLVGPRPEETRLVERYGETERFRMQMRPGITGPMQVHGRGELTFGERLAVEREYVENYSFRKDVSLLLKTASAVAGGRGAF